MKKIGFVIAAMMALCLVMLTACGGDGGDSSSADKGSSDLTTLRDVSWEGTELTIKLGENKSTGCEWKTKPQDDSVIDYSVNRKFKLSSEVTKGEAVGTLEAGFKGKGAGTSQVVCTTPVDWDGSGDGYCYIVTVTVNEDGTIKDAKGEESETKPAEESKQPAQSDQTLEEYLAANNIDTRDWSKEANNAGEDYNKVVKLDIKVKGNTINYFYTLRQEYSPEEIEELKPKLKDSLKESKSSLKEKIKTMEEQTGVKGIKIYMEYQTKDGDKICGKKFK